MVMEFLTLSDNIQIFRNNLDCSKSNMFLQRVNSVALMNVGVKWWRRNDIGSAMTMTFFMTIFDDLFRVSLVIGWAVLGGGLNGGRVPHPVLDLTWTGGSPPSGPWMGYPSIWTWNWVPPIWTWDGVPPPPSGPWMGTSPSWTWDEVSRHPHLGCWYTPPPPHW